MNRKYLLGCVGIVLIVGVAVAAGDGTWVSADGDRHKIHGKAHGMFIAEDDAETFDVADLADGETRILCTGEKQVTATRSGEVVTLSRNGSAGSDDVSVTCSLPQDSCKVLTFPSDSEKVFIVVEKTRTCENGVGDCDAHVELIEGLPEGANRIIVRRTVECDDDGDCNEFEDVSEHAGAHAMIHVETIGAPGEDVVVMGDHGPGNVFVMHGDDTMLRCPEGDARMHVDKDEIDEVYLCPKHSLPMEKVESPGHKRIRIKKIGSDDE